jgi:UDP-N-acetylmuramoyl-L-alanyl-D-glutamate--2,6-diaminopimelate ligase
VLEGAQEATREQGLATQLIDGGDRRSAIRTALQHAGPGDVVAILGKGHELGQEINGQIHPFSDIEVVRQEWAALGTGRDTGEPR